MRRKRRAQRWCMGRELGSCSGVYPTRSQPCSLHSPGTEKAEDGSPRCSRCPPPPSRMSRSVGEMTQSASSSPGEGATFEHLWSSL